MLKQTENNNNNNKSLYYVLKQIFDLLGTTKLFTSLNSYITFLSLMVDAKNAKQKFTFFLFSMACVKKCSE